MTAKTFGIPCMLIVCVLSLGCNPASAPATNPGSEGGEIPNPASVYCLKQGYRVDSRSDAQGNQYGVCIFPSGIECDEWAYFHGECTQDGRSPNAENKAVEATRIFLANELNIVPDQVIVFAVKTTTWPDSCLGLAAQDEKCMLVETPGFRVTLTVGETNYTYRTDLTGENIRLETSGIQG